MIDRVHRFLCIFLLFLILSSLVVPPVVAVDPLGWLSGFFKPSDNITRLDTSDWPDAPPIIKERVDNEILPINTRIFNTSLGWVPARGALWDIFLVDYQENETHTFEYQYRIDTGSQITVPLEIRRSYYTADGKLAYTVYLYPQHGAEGNWDALIKCHCRVAEGPFYAEKDIYHDSHISFDSYQQFVAHNMSIIKATDSSQQNKLSFYVTNYGGFSAATFLTYNITAETVGYRNGVSERWRPQSAGVAVVSFSGGSDTLIDTITYRSDVDYDSYDYVRIPIKIYKGSSVLCEQDVYYFPPNPTPNALQLLVNSSSVAQGEDVVFTPKLYNSQSPSYRSDDYIVNIVVNDPLGSQWGSYSATSNVDYTVAMTGGTGQYKARAYCKELNLWSDWVTINVSQVKPNAIDFSVTPTDIKFGKNVTFQHRLYNTEYSTQSYDGYTVAIGVYRNYTSLVWSENVTSNQPLTIPFDVLPPGDYMARAALFDFVQPQQTIVSNEVTIHVTVPNKLEFLVAPANVTQGQSVTFTNKLYNTANSSDLYDGYTVTMLASSDPSSDPWRANVTSNTPYTVPLDLPPGNYTVQAGWICYPYTTFSVSSDPVNLTITVPAERVLPVYPVSTEVPFTPINRTNLTGFDADSWLIFNLPSDVVANVDGNLHDLVWGLQIMTPHDFFLWMRGSAGQVPLNVSEKTREQLEIEAQDDSTTNPLHFIVSGCQYVADQEHYFMQYILTLIRQNPYYLIQHDISVVLTRIVPGFIWNVAALVVFLAGAIRIFVLYRDYH